MATTGFKPVKNRLQRVIDYVKNPEKTGEPEGQDLFRTLHYVEDEDKTEQKFYVSGINCPPKQACACMMATKRRYGKLSGNVAYHAYQSFRTGEVTPQEAHDIGMETARRMWGEDFEVVVATHLNTDNIHNHMVINSVSFRTGKKFENHVSDHYRLREISDEVCREHGKSILPQEKFTGSRRKEYWVRKKGGMTHRDMLRRDIEAVLARSQHLDTFEYQLKSLGYRIYRDRDYKHMSVIAPGWKRPVRLDSMGYTDEVLHRRIMENREEGYHEPIVLRHRHFPVLDLEKKLNYEIYHSRDTAIVLVDVLFYIFLQLLQLAQTREDCQPYSPAFRHALPSEGKLRTEYQLLREQDLHTEEDVLDFIDSTDRQIELLEQKRQEIRNSNRRPKTPEERKEKNAAAREVSKEIKPLRKQLKLAEKVLEHYPKIWEHLKTEQKLEKKALERKRERSR